MKTKSEFTPQRFGYVGGTFTDNEIAEARERNIPLTMDCALPGSCLNDCTYCGFLRVNHSGKLSQGEILNVFSQFSQLGGKSIKILGEGEPLLRRDMLFLVRSISDLGMIPVLFTCGDVLGSEELANKIYGLPCHRVISNLFSAGATVMLKYEKKDQDGIVQRGGYSAIRNAALDNLLAAGFSSSGYPSRLGFSNVLTNDNYAEVNSVFAFALRNHIYPLVCPLMPIGKMCDVETRIRYSPEPHKIAKLSHALRAIGIDAGLEFTETPAFPGGLPCDVSRTGFYLDDVGNIKLCEADDVVGSVREIQLRDLWWKCSNLKDSKYGNRRWEGCCFPKIEKGILHETKAE